MNTPTRKTLAVLVDNEAGVLSRVVRLFSGKGYNIESSPSARPTIPPSPASPSKSSPVRIRRTSFLPSCGS